MHREWENVFESSRGNVETFIMKAPCGELHWIQKEGTLDGKRFGAEVNIGAIMEAQGIDSDSDRFAFLITDRVVTPDEAARMCLIESFPEELLPYVHVHD